MRDFLFPFLFGLFLCLAVGSSTVLATEDWDPILDGDALNSLSVPPGEGTLPAPGVLALPDSELHARTRAVLDHFQAPDPAIPSADLQFLNARQTPEGIRALLRWFDPQKGFASFNRLEGPVLSSFLDWGSRKQEHFAVRLAGDDVPQTTPLQERLRFAARNNSAEKPLAGLRIALDPGHMGSPEWYRRTGKWAHDHRGRRLSEGLLTLQTALLLQREFESLGATVTITRDALRPATDITYEGLDLATYARAELPRKGLDLWFRNLLAYGPGGHALVKRFERSREVKLLFSEGMRAAYYVHRADLEARAVKMESIDPDITIVIHYDVNPAKGDPNAVQRGYNAVKAYVPGGYFKKEFATLQDRALFARHILDASAWEASLGLSRSIVRAMSRDLKIPLQQFHGSNGQKVEPGVFARNLYLTRRLPQTALSFLECLVYNTPEEFGALIRPDHTLEIAGKTTHYSERLLQVVRSIRDGTVLFVKGQKQE